MSRKRKELTFNPPDLWYLVGLITSDGYLSPDGRHIDITSADDEFLRNLTDSLKLGYKIGAKYNKNRQKSYRIQIANRKFYQFLLSMGLAPNKSLSIGALNIPDELFIDFLRGLIDGDGCISKWFHPASPSEQWSLRISSGSNEFLRWLNEKIYAIFELKGKIYQENDSGTSHRLKFSKMAARRILGRCYYDGCFGLERKIRAAKDCVILEPGWRNWQTRET